MSKKVSIIVATDLRGLIGLDGTMPWHYKADFKRFKEVTMGGALIMGRRTWESLPKPLPGRLMVVLTRQGAPLSKHPAGSCHYVRDFPEALDVATNEHVWVAGGAEIYKLALEQHGEMVHGIDYTCVPAVEAEKMAAAKEVTWFDKAWLSGYAKMAEWTNEEDSRLKHIWYEKAKAVA